MSFNSPLRSGVTVARKSRDRGRLWSSKGGPVIVLTLFGGARGTQWAVDPGMVHDRTASRPLLAARSLHTALRSRRSSSRRASTCRGSGNSPAVLLYKQRGRTASYPLLPVRKRLEYDPRFLTPWASSAVAGVRGRGCPFPHAFQQLPIPLACCRIPEVPFETTVPGRTSDFVRLKVRTQ